MAISPTTYSVGDLLRRRSPPNPQDDELQKKCSNCRRGMYKTDHGTLQCENCELEEDK